MPGTILEEAKRAAVKVQQHAHKTALLITACRIVTVVLLYCE
jgi:hypothetical protein